MSTIPMSPPQISVPPGYAPHDPSASHAAQVAYDNEKKSEGVAYALWFFLGAVGGHRFYSGDTGYALGMLFTLGGLGVWTIVDVFLIGKRIKQTNREKWLHVANHYGVRA